nr:hypothetical protein [Tanacetum cinerariifolium]
MLSDSNNDDTSSNDDVIEDIEYVEASLTDSELVSLEEENDGRLTSVVMNDISDNSTNDPLLEAIEIFLASDNSIPPGIENFDYDSEGDIYFLEELLSNDSLPLPKNDSSNFGHHDDPYGYRKNHKEMAKTGQERTRDCEECSNAGFEDIFVMKQFYWLGRVSGDPQKHK